MFNKILNLFKRPKSQNDYFTVDNLGNQHADLQSYFLSEKGKKELEETDRVKEHLFKENNVR